MTPTLDLQSISVGAVAVYIVARDVVPYLIRRRNGKNGTGREGSTHQMVRDLHTWHDQRDEDGVPVWYVRKSLERSIDNLTVAIKELAERNGS